MALETYQKKRDLSKTPEPPADAPVARSERLQFCVQEHAASHHHYDFRLEVDGVLKSWAVPKGPSLDPKQKRLAVATEDHPLSYGDFEGIIPQGEYGGGSVLLWDRGYWRCQGDPRRGLERGRLDFELFGDKLRGGWRLVRLADKGEKQEAWLLIKRSDAVAAPGSDDEVVRRRRDSVISGRTLDDVAAQPDRTWHGRQPAPPVGARLGSPSALPEAVPAALPSQAAPALATLVDAPPAGDGWLHELKHDGYRLLCRVDGPQVSLWTRSGNDWTERFPSVREALAPLGAHQALLDGEVVVLDPRGRSDFGALQNALDQPRADLVLYAFDLLHLDGYDLRAAPLRARKEALRLLLAEAELGPGIRYSDHVVGRGRTFYEEACRAGLEGIVCKRADAPYREGRHRLWLKVKCRPRQELVIVGYARGQGHRERLGALLLAARDEGGALRYAGKVGTGFDRATITSLRDRLDPLARDSPPVDVRLPPRERTRVVWVEPRCVAEVEVHGFTHEGHVRHASFVALREDKPADEVRREEPEPLAGPRGTARREVAGVALTNPDKVLYPEVGLTKSDIATYYEAIAPLVLPGLRDRPLTLVRCPEGWEGECFHQKRANRATPQALSRVTVRPGVEYTTVRSLADLIALVQLGVLELHVWGARDDEAGIDRPDLLVLDLDPDEDVPWANVVTTAVVLRTRLGQLGLEAFVRSTGGKGLHLVAPIAATLTWPQVKAFTHGIAKELVRHAPDHFTDRIPKARRKGKILIDYLRNAAEATAIASYSLRARAGAPVAVPLSWAEVEASTAPIRLGIDAVLRRAREGLDPWRDFEAARRPVSEKALRLA